MENESIRQEALNKLLDIISYEEKKKLRTDKYRLMGERARKRTRKLRLYYASGITAAACLIGVFFILLPKESTSHDELYNMYYATHNYYTEYREDGVEMDNYLKSIHLYQKGRASEALAIIHPLFLESPLNPDYLLLQSLIWMELREYEKAQQGLQSAIKFGGSYEATGLWYLGLNHLALEDIQSAEEVFRRIGSMEAPILSKKSKKILRKLR